MNRQDEAATLKQEAQSILSSNGGIRRAAEYTPSLEELESTPFYAYVRHRLLGVPTGVETESEEEEEEEEEEQKEESNTEKKTIANRVVTRSSRRKAMEMKRMKKRPSPTSISSEKVCQPCKEKLGDGIAKVTLPEGWWDYKGIGKDLTARGRKWQKGSKLGDIIISSSIKQCPSGIGGVYDFTLIENPPITVADFREKADRYRKVQMGESFSEDMSDDYIDNIARKFWRRLGPTMEPSHYGADVSGSFFDGDDATGWNVDQLDTCIQLLRVDLKDGEKDTTYSLPGVTSAYLYFGMWASVFAAHTEDMNLLSINYLHAGSPKYWYAISPEDSQRFQSLAISHFGAAAAQCPEFLRHKRYLLSPAILRKAGIGFTTQIQRPGDAIITFPGSYHFGFNTGFNIAESTNFAVPEWVPLGRTARVCMCHPHSVRIDMKRFEELLQDYNDQQQSSRPITSYREWGKYRALQRTRREQAARLQQLHLSPKEQRHLPPKRPTFQKGLVVRLSFLSRYPNTTPSSRTSSTPETKSSSIQRKRRKSPKQRRRNHLRDPGDQYRLALKVKQTVFIRNTNVLCIQPCDDDDENDEGGENFFSGKITNVVENHVRIHFHGMVKDADVWMTKDSDSLFLDGGPAGIPPSSTTEGGDSKREKVVVRRTKKAKPQRLIKRTKVKF